MSRDWTREEFGITDNTPVVDIDSLERKCERLQKQLDIAVRALRGVSVWANTGNGGEQAVKKLCNKALKEIREIE